MELDVHLTREEEEPWGFELAGGEDGALLVIDKVYPSSPADLSGLQPGDIVARIGDKLTTELSLESATRLVADAVGSLAFGICRGLYDPVLDDYDPIYETDPGDLDRQSATEVQPQDDPYPTGNHPYPDPYGHPTDPNANPLCNGQSYPNGNVSYPTNINENVNYVNGSYQSVPSNAYEQHDGRFSRNLQTPIDEISQFQRSLTSSPLLKPYRPFSTEPLEVKPIENPIILNPKYNDKFRVSDETRGVNLDDLLGDVAEKLGVSKYIESKFKLPISKQYDPNYGKKVGEILENINKEEEIKTDSVTTEIASVVEKSSLITEVDMKTELSVSKEVNFKEEKKLEEELCEIESMKYKTETEVESVEKTALNIVEESIERAVSVTEEIHREVEEELRASQTRELSEIVKESKEVISQSQLKEECVEVRKSSREEIAEVGLTETVQYDKKIVAEEESYKEVQAESRNTIDESVTIEDLSSEVTSKVYKEDDKREKEVFKEERRNMQCDGNVSTNYYEESDFSTTEKAFKIGLQTIPNIRGMVQSSHHFDLLLRTFFIHLTDVMVALSRFILTQPITQLDAKSEKVIKEKLVSMGQKVDKHEVKTSDIKKTDRDVKQSQVAKSDMKTKERDDKVTQKVSVAKSEELNKKQVTKNYVQEETRREENKQRDVQKQEIKIEEYDGEEYDKRRISGAEMSQRTQRKSKDLTDKMEAVITEFEKKSGLEEETIRRRSRSRSRLEEEITERTEVTETREEYERKQRSVTEEYNNIQSTDGKQMYVAIVESHVYTNKDAIISEMTKKAEEKAAEVETVATEAISTIAAKAIEAKSSIEKAELATVTAKSEATVQKSEEIKLDSSKEFNEVKMEKREASIKQEMLTNIASESTETTSISDVKTFESKQVIDNKAVVISEETIKEAALESMEVALESTQEVTENKMSMREASVSKQELLTSVASEKTEVVVDDSKVKSFEAFEATSKSLKLATEEIYKATAVQSTNVLIEEAKEEITELKMNKQQASAKVEQLAIASAESTDIVADDSEIKLLDIKDVASKKAVIKSEETYKTAAIESTDIAFEVAEEEHAISLEKEAIVREDNRHLAVAGIIEAKVEECKVKQQTYDEENAALKIVKHEIVDVENVVQINEESLDVRESLEVTNIVESNTSISQKTSEISNESRLKIGKSNLKLVTDEVVLSEKFSSNIIKSNSNGDLIDTPTPSTVPPTPLTDEYMFKLQIPLPKSRSSTPFIHEEDQKCTDEDPHIVKKKLIPHIEAEIEEQIIYDPPLPTPPEYIREIERKSSLLASAIDETIKSIEEYKEEVGIDRDPSIVKRDVVRKVKEEPQISPEEEELKAEISRAEEELLGFRTVPFNPAGKESTVIQNVQVPEEGRESKMYTDDKGELIGTVQGIVDGLEEATVDDDVAKELGRPGINDENMSKLITGESDMMREAHVMGLKRVITSHMHRPEDEEEYQKIKPLVPSLKNSEVIKMLNDELKEEEQKKAEDKKWTTFLQKPKRPVPKTTFGYHGYITQNVEEEKPYTVKIVKQPKPKVAPDYKPEDFNTGPLPWEERALTEPAPSPVALEDPILVPEEIPEFLEAVDPLPESEVPDLEDTGIPLPPPLKIVTLEVVEESEPGEEEEDLQAEDIPEEVLEEEDPEDMDMSVEKKAEKLVESVKSMVDPSAPIDQQLAQMRAQLAALAQLPCVIQQSLESLTKHLSVMGQQHMESMQMQVSNECQMMEESYEQTETTYTEDNNTEAVEEESQLVIEEMLSPIEEAREEMPPTEEQIEEKRQRQAMMEEEKTNEKQRKLQEASSKLEQESRQIKQRPTPRVGKPKRMFGPQNPEERPLVLPGGRRWRGPQDAFDEQTFAETVQAQSELIQGKAMGINFKKFDKPPVSLDHLQNSEVFKVVHHMDQTPKKKVDFLTPVVGEADYRERCRSITPAGGILNGPQQFQP